MTGRERVLAALDGLEPDRVPLALSFYHLDAAALAPPGMWRDDLVDIGVAAINPLQPEHMDAVRIRRRYRPRLALWGTIGHQTTFAFACPEQIRAEIAERVASLGREGLILCPAYDIDEPDVSWENIAAFLEAGAAFG